MFMTEMTLGRPALRRTVLGLIATALCAACEARVSMDDRSGDSAAAAAAAKASAESAQVAQSDSVPRPTDGLALSFRIEGGNPGELRAIAGRIADALRGYPRVQSVVSDTAASPPSKAGAPYTLNVRYEFRGPRKLADRTQTTLIEATRVPDGYRVLPGG
jgi:hypothetical protein